MGYGVMAYLVDLSKIKDLCGSGNKRFLNRVLKSQRAEIGALDDDFDCEEICAKDALATLINGDEMDEESAHLYGYALKIICEELGEFLPNSSWCPIHFDFLEDVDKNLKELKLKPSLKITNLLFNGAPIDLPFIEDFPGIGHLSTDDAAKILKQLDKVVDGSDFQEREGISSARQFHFSDGSSNKFWTIDLRGKSHIVHFGREGTKGQKKEKEFATTTAAEKDYERLISQKTKKGYIEVTKKSSKSKARPKKAENRQPKLDSEVVESLFEFRSWLVTAVKKKQGLMFFYH